MGLSSFLIALSPLFAPFPTEVSGPMLYALHRKQAEKAFECYLTHANETQAHDFTLLQQAAITLLEEGAHSKDPEIQLLCMFGAGVAASNELLTILERGMHSEDLRTQLIALSYLGRLQDDEADKLLLEALSSPYLIVRLESLLELAQKNHPAVLGHLYSISAKVPSVVRAALAQIAIHLEGSEAARYLQKLLTDVDPQVRVETILNVAKAHRDDFLPTLRMLACGASSPEQEALAIAFGELKDQSATPRLKEFAQSKQEGVRLASCIALHRLGETGYREFIENDARQGSLFAIAALGKLRSGKETLATLLSTGDRDVRLNALIALLELKDKRVLPYLRDILIEDVRNLGFWRHYSASGGLKAWRIISSASEQNKKNYPGLSGQTIGLRETILAKCIEFEEADFLEIARQIITSRQYALVPLLMDLMENKKSEGIISFLKEGQQKAGAPLLRNYCTLALYRLKEKGPYEEHLIKWIGDRGSEELIRFRDGEDPSSSFSRAHELTPEETSRFLIEACEALASAQNIAGIETLIRAIAYGNPKNRYALAGLLLRTTE